MWLSLKELAGYAQQDAHEFFISALNQIHADSQGKKVNSASTSIPVHRLSGYFNRS
jgi:ubiquitin carboxyl-terminal hydrolase 22/27/51